MVTRDVSYFVFDIESVADGALLSRLRYPSDSLSPEMAITKYREELIEETGKDFIPYTFQLPVSLVVAKIAADYKLTDLVALDEEQSRPHEITRLFWDGWRKYGKPCLVSFHGRGFDLPLLELAAFRYGLEIPDWFAESKRSFEQPRNRYNIASHFDLHEWLTNFGASRFHGGLSLAANLIGKPGKMDVSGYMVQDMWNAGKKAEIHDYCRSDVLDTYFVFLRSRVVAGEITIHEEHAIIEHARKWIETRAKNSPGLHRYLTAWGDWKSPWEAVKEEPLST
ncbi:MAG: 3'-5' exonuclease [Planctomycetota bacterium]|mgnify:CR=1 FL=1|jgi:3'-5' exonuclease|nr:3'-5' exonuclease [Planctomycetia bacterium]RLS57452.1 MAG: 3'-5' exonuclease [Planctomycetota bacterium]